MSGPQHYLVSFEDVHATCGGFDISDITELHISAPANGVPQVTLLVAAGTPAEGEPADIGGVSLSNARTIFEACRSLVRTDGGTLDLSLTCRTVGAEGESTQSLHLAGWMLVDVALSPVQRRGVCNAALTFAHPLYKAHLGGAMVGLLAQQPQLSAVYGENPLAVFVSALNAYASAARIDAPSFTVPGTAASLIDIQKGLHGQLLKAIAALSSAVAWRGGGLPAANALGGQVQALWLGLASYGIPTGNSVLHTLLSSLIPECSLALGGDFTAPSLELGPFTPWADPAFTIPDSDIVSFDFPHSDTVPISGVRLTVEASSGGDVVSWNALGCQAGNGAKPFEIFYVPQSELSAEYMYGPIQQFVEPGWLVHTAAYGSGLRARGESDVVTARDGTFHSPANVPRGEAFPLSGGVGDVPAIDYARAALQCAKAYFETSYRKDWEFTATLRLMFSGDAGMLCPGRVLSITSDSSEVVAGYVTLVDHVISVANRTATTKIVCSHPRFDGLPAAITSSANALYA